MSSETSSTTLRSMAAMLPLAAAAAANAAPEAPALVLAAQSAAYADLQRPLKLRVQSVRALGDWGFVLAELRGSDDGPFDYAGTRFEEAAREGYVSRRFVALLARRGGSWQVIESRIGPTDAAWSGWAEKHHAPPQIFATP